MPVLLPYYVLEQLFDHSNIQQKERNKECPQFKLLCSNRACAAKFVLIHVKFGNELQEQESDFSEAKVSHLGDYLEMNYNFLNIISLKAQSYLKTKTKKKSKLVSQTKKKHHSPDLKQSMENVKC